MFVVCVFVCFRVCSHEVARGRAGRGHDRGGPSDHAARVTDRGRRDGRGYEEEACVKPVTSIVEPLTSIVEPLTSTLEPLASTPEPLASTPEPLASTEKRAPRTKTAR
eukprot:355738-Prorocentrum_minimum.AAC.1